DHLLQISACEHTAEGSAVIIEILSGGEHVIVHLIAVRLLHVRGSKGVDYTHYEIVLLSKCGETGKINALKSRVSGRFYIHQSNVAISLNGFSNSLIVVETDDYGVDAE